MPPKQMTQEIFDSMSQEQQQKFIIQQQQAQLAAMNPAQRKEFLAHQQKMRDMTPKQRQQYHHQQQQRQQQQQQLEQKAFMNSRKERLTGVISTDEWEQTVEVHEESGKGFRLFFYLLILALVGLLVYMKYDVEVYVQIPERVLKVTAQEMHGGKKNTEMTHDEKEQAKRLYNSYKVLSGIRLIPNGGAADEAGPDDDSLRKSEFTKPVDDSVEGGGQPDGSGADKKPEDTSEDGGGGGGKDESDAGSTQQELEAETRERRKKERVERQLANWRLRKEMSAKFDSHSEQYGQLVTCDKDCQTNHNNMQIAIDTLNGHVDRDLYSVLLDDTIKMSEDGSIKQTRTYVDVDELKEKADEKKKEVVDSTEEGSELRSMQLAEIQDAYDILVNHEARTYYHMYGLKAPAFMKKQSARHGGWGMEVLLKTFKNRLVMEWLNAVDTTWADWAVLGAIGFIGFVMPVLIQLPKIWEMANDMETRWNEMAELEKKQELRNSRSAKE